MILISFSSFGLASQSCINETAYRVTVFTAQQIV